MFCRDHRNPSKSVIKGTLTQRSGSVSSYVTFLKHTYCWDLHTVTQVAVTSQLGAGQSSKGAMVKAEFQMNMIAGLSSVLLMFIQMFRLGTVHFSQMVDCCHCSLKYCLEELLKTIYDYIVGTCMKGAVRLIQRHRASLNLGSLG